MVATRNENICIRNVCLKGMGNAGTQFVVEESLAGRQYDLVVLPLGDVIDECGVAFLLESDIGGVDVPHALEVFAEHDDTRVVAAPQLIVDETHVHLHAPHVLLEHLLPRHHRLALARRAAAAGSARSALWAWRGLLRLQRKHSKYVCGREASFK